MSVVVLVAVVVVVVAVVGVPRVRLRVCILVLDGPQPPALRGRLATRRASRALLGRIWRTSHDYDNEYGNVGIMRVWLVSLIHKWSEQEYT